MSHVMSIIKGVQPQRGFWLRCFLDGAIWTALILAAAPGFSSQIDIPGPEHLTHVEGLVVNTSGHAVADLEVTLVKDDKIAFQTRTEQIGGVSLRACFRPIHVST